MNVTCDLNNFIKSVAESVNLTLDFFKGMPNVNWDTFTCCFAVLVDPIKNKMISVIQ